MIRSAEPPGEHRYENWNNMKIRLLHDSERVNIEAELVTLAYHALRGSGGTLPRSKTEQTI